MLRVLVLSDTHAPRFAKALPNPLRPHLESADLVLHAGDVCTGWFLDELAVHAPVHAVLGNNDGADVAAWGGGVPETLELDLEGLRVAMIHDAGARAGRGRRMRRRFPSADLVVYGHSHIPMDVVDDGAHLFNPGSPTDKRRQPDYTIGWLGIEGGDLVEHRIEPVER
ncbi:YfcE family phosphodiesterase [Marihabitans asiaticum]|uniref:Phosphoesterase n=1 Tax=Marihabitans asiaticum TaxID=415218 RepID=A0A560WET2_9MICO|nr:metallophosphoesterase family protein [Marihabitans asiaticum]TWD16024.1 hypothetical protein FB557_1565 [Marihabitans asiaticum]